ncbi:MAG: hypothetical protein KBT02_05840 [Treponema sp.]|nr:hypothetical protein [Candidatus Treponema caballi]
MMKECLRFVLLVMLTAVLFSSCASDDAAESQMPEETVPVVAVEVNEEPLPEVPDSVLSEPELPAVEDILPEAAETEPVVQEEAVFEEIVLSEEYIENEFIPVEEEPLYTIDVVAYYDDFSVADNEFVDVEIPVFEEIEPVIPEPPVLPVKEDEVRKPVVVITEEEAVASSEREKEIALSELESILEKVPEEETPPSPVPSRSITIHKNDIIDCPYQGNWWVYLGDMNGSNSVVFMGRDYISNKTVFTLRASKEGTALLHFFKQDIIGGVMVDDYLEVTVEESIAASEKITLDEFIISQIQDDDTVAVDYVQYQEKSASVSDEPVMETVPVSLPEVTFEAESSIVSDEEEVTSVVEEILNPDEDLFMRAQELEKTDIEGALILYTQLVSAYPASPYWNQASKRITYINRFYFFKR